MKLRVIPRPEDNLWEIAAPQEMRDYLLQNQVRWDPSRSRWFTKKSSVASFVVSDDFMAGWERRKQQQAASILASRAKSSDIEIPVPAGLSYLPYQKAGIAYALSRPATLIGDDMGLGKTVQAIGVINADHSIWKVLIMCPASLQTNWYRETSKWLTRPLSIAVATSAGSPAGIFDITICSYTIADKLRPEFARVAWDLIILDEAHLLKNPNAKRTVAIFGRAAKRKTAGHDATPAIPPLQARRRIALTGTPIPNRVSEAFPILHFLDPVTWRHKGEYEQRFCNASFDGNGHRDTSGASNLQQLQTKLRSSIMIRRLKDEVLTELPAKRRQVIEFPPGGASGVISAELAAYELRERELLEWKVRLELAKASEDIAEYRHAVGQLRASARVQFTELSKVRHATALEKLPQVIEHLKGCVDAGKVICFAHHSDVIDGIYHAFPNSALITGQTPAMSRQAQVDKFQKDPRCRLFVGNIQAAGVGLTLTASSHVVFAELDWVPGNITQAEDRAHRLGQKNSVLVQHLVLEGSLDARMARVTIEKQEVIDKALDSDTEEDDQPVTVIPSTTDGVTRKAIFDTAASITPRQIVGIHQAVRHIATLPELSNIDAGIAAALLPEPFLTPRQAALGLHLVKRYQQNLGEKIISLCLNN